MRFREIVQGSGFWLGLREKHVFCGIEVYSALDYLISTWHRWMVCAKALSNALAPCPKINPYEANSMLVATIPNVLLKHSTHNELSMTLQSPYVPCKRPLSLNM